MLATLALALLLPNGTPPGPGADGRRIDLDGATLFVPEGFRDSGPVDLLLHLHGTPTVVEPAFVEAGWPGVLIAFNRNGLSSVYTAPFKDDPELLAELIAKAMKALADAKLATDPKPGRVVVSTFSAGFGGLREILKSPANADRIDAVILADSLYSGYAGDAKDHKVDPDLMAPFHRFADQAASGKKAFVLTHSSQIPEGYASTTETATDLILRVGALPLAPAVSWGADWKPTRRMVKGRFEALGFEGIGPDDHMRHLRQIAKIWAEARRVIDGR